MEHHKIFILFFDKYIMSLEERLKKNRYLQDNCFFKSVHESLYNELFSLSYMTLIYELNNFREQGLLKGETSEERYRYFEDILGSDNFFDYIKEKYPVLINLMTNVTNHFLESTERVVNSFYQDKKILNSKFKKDFSEIEDIEIGVGDIHNLGDSVAIVKGNFGKIVYKPNKLINDAIFNELTDMINPHLSVKLKKIAIIHLENHGWQEFIEHTNCKNTFEIQNFYRRLGYYLSLFYILNSCDFHYENIIALGEYPSIIDLETLITVSNDSSKDEGILYNLLRDNVLRSGLLPTRTQDSYLDLDLSGFSGGEMKSSQHKMYEIKNIGTDRMVVREELLTNETRKTHKPFIDENPINVLEYLTDFLEGFEESMYVLINIKEELLKWVSSKIFMESRYRQVLRATYIYGKILSSGNYPTYLIDIDERKKLFNKLINKNENEKSIDELNNLLIGLIPAYECKYDSKDLMRNNRVIQKKYFNETPNEVTVRKINSLTEETVRFQKRLIECSLLTILKDLVIPDKLIKTEYLEGLSLENNLKKVYENIISYEVPLDNYTVSDLFQTRIMGEKYIISGSNFSLYEGGGLIWAIYCYGIYSRDNNILKFAKRLLNKAEINYNNLKKGSTCSAFSDTAGAIYLYYNFYITTGDKKYLSKFKKYLENYSLEIQSCSEIDYVNGISGAIHLLSNLYKEYEDNDLKRIIIMAINKFESLLKNKIPKSLGIAHGTVGIALALMDSYEITGKYLFFEKLKNLLLDDCSQSFSNNRSWCNGLGGIVLGYADILKRLNIDELVYEKILKKFKKYLELYLSLCRRNNVCLCHGSSGELEVMNILYSSYSSLLSQQELVMINKEIIDMSTNIPDTNGNNMGVPFGLSLDTFMTGASGVAYTQLRMKQQNFPSVFMLEITKNIKENIKGEYNEITKNIISY